MDHGGRHSSDITMTSPDRNGYNTTTRTRNAGAKPRARKGMVSRFGYNLSTFFKETWRSILAIFVMGGVTGAVSAYLVSDNDKTNIIKGLDGTTCIQSTLPRQFLLGL